MGIFISVRTRHPVSPFQGSISYDDGTSVVSLVFLFHLYLPVSTSLEGRRRIEQERKTLTSMKLDNRFDGLLDFLKAGRFF